MKLILFCAAIVHSALGLPQWNLNSQLPQGEAQHLQWNTLNQQDQQWGNPSLNEQQSWMSGGQQNVDQSQFGDASVNGLSQWDQERLLQQQQQEQQLLGGLGQMIQDGQQVWGGLNQIYSNGQQFLGGQQVPPSQNFGMGQQFMGQIYPGQGIEQQYMGGESQWLGRGRNQGLEQPIVGGLNQVQQWHHQLLGGLFQRLGDRKENWNQGLLGRPWRQQDQQSWGFDQSIQGNLGSLEGTLTFGRRPPSNGGRGHGPHGKHGRHPGRRPHGPHGGRPQGPGQDRPIEHQPPAQQKPEQSELEQHVTGLEQQIPKLPDLPQQKPEVIVSETTQLEQETSSLQNIEAVENQADLEQDAETGTEITPESTGEEVEITNDAEEISE